MFCFEVKELVMFIAPCLLWLTYEVIRTSSSEIIVVMSLNQSVPA